MYTWAYTFQKQQLACMNLMLLIFLCDVQNVQAWSFSYKKQCVVQRTHSTSLTIEVISNCSYILALHYDVFCMYCNNLVPTFECCEITKHSCSVGADWGNLYWKVLEIGWWLSMKLKKKKPYGLHFLGQYWEDVSQIWGHIHIQCAQSTVADSMQLCNYCA